MSSGATVLLMARAPRRGEVLRALEPVLGSEGCRALQIALIERVAGWAGAVTGRPLHVAHDPPDAGEELRAAVGDGASVFPQNGNGIAARLADATARLFAHGHGPLLVVWPDLPRWRPEHASGALDDLEHGCEISIGPVFDGGLYLIALGRPLPELFALPEPTWRSPDVMTVALAAAQDANLEVGILRAERGLHRPADVRAALADPLLPPELKPLLTAPGGC